LAQRRRTRFVSVVSGERGQVHAGDGAQEPGGLEIFLYAAAGSVRLGAALDGAGVDSDLLDAVEVSGMPRLGRRGGR